MKQSFAIQKAQEALSACFGDVPAVRLTIDPSPVPKGPDIAGTIELPSGGAQRLFAKVRPNGQPRFIREAAFELDRLTSAWPNAYGVVIAPFFSHDAADICRQAGMGYADFAGNCRLATGGIFIERQGHKNTFVRKAELLGLFKPVAARVLRVLLSHKPRLWKTLELAHEAGVSLGHAHNVRKALIDREWGANVSGGFSLTKPDLLLAEWSDNYNFRKNEVLEYFSPLEIPQFEALVSEVLGEQRRSTGILPVSTTAVLAVPTETKVAFTGFAGAARFAPLVKYQKVMLYVSTAHEELAQRLGLRKVSSGSNISLLKPYDDGVFYGLSRPGGLPVVSAIQLYLDLKGYRGRGEEAAQALLETIIQPLWRS